MSSLYTPRADQAISLARKIATEYNYPCISTDHLLYGLLSTNSTGVAANVLMSFGVDIDEALESTKKLIVSNKTKTPVKGTLSFSPKLKKALKIAESEATSQNLSYVGTEHLLLGLLGTDDTATHLLPEDINIDQVRDTILQHLNPASNIDDHIPDEEDDLAVAGPSSHKQGRKKQTFLGTYAKNLNQLAKEGKLDPVIGRQDTIQRMIQVLGRRTKNNPVIIGEPGVGKTAIVEGLAQEIVSNRVPKKLADKTVYILDMAAMVAGTKYRGQFEERLKGVLKEVAESGKAIVFLDEMHTVIGAGSAEGSMDASNMIKPALSRRELQMIGATTLSEYRKHVEKDGALARRFQKVSIDEPKVLDAIKILQGLAKHYQDHHNVIFSPEAIEACVKLSERYITDRHLPDKAIDVLDEVGSAIRMKCSNVPPELYQVEEELESVLESKQNAVDNQNYESAAEFRNIENELKEKLEQIQKSWKDSEDEVLHITETDVQKIIAGMTGIPAGNLDSSETSKVLSLEEDLSKNVISQTEAITKISKAIRRNKAGLGDPNRPIGSFLFLGPTGVGKTHITKSLTKNLFGDIKNLIQLDMSEYMEKHTVSRLVGSPPGYIGHNEGGQLTEAVRTKPYSVVLFDEIEKAHPDVVQILLQVLEEGHITDSLGNKVNFKNTVIILTSNVGAEFYSTGGACGFGVSSDPGNYDAIKNKVLDKVKQTFKPEFLNRLSDQVVFKSLEKEDYFHILDLEVAKIQTRLVDRNITINLTKKAKEFIVEEGTDVKNGARPLKRAIEKHLEDLLSESILRNEITPNSTVTVRCKEQTLSFDCVPTAKVSKGSSSKQKTTSA